jgi:hypothetical protein
MRGLDMSKHFMKVNNVSKKIFLQEKEKAFELWRERNLITEWKQDLSYKEEYICKN